MKYFIFFNILLFSVYTTSIQAKDVTGNSCAPAEHRGLYEKLSVRDAYHQFKHSVPHTGILKNLNVRDTLANVYASYLNEQGTSYVLVGVDLTVGEKKLRQGKTKMAYYLMKLDAAGKQSSDKTFIEFEAQFLGTSIENDHLKTELSFLPFEYITGKDYDKFSAAVAKAEIEKPIYKSEDGSYEINTFILAELLAYGHLKMHKEDQDLSTLDLAKFNIGINFENEDLKAAVYLKQNLGVTHMAKENKTTAGLNGTGYGTQITWKALNGDKEKIFVDLKYEHENKPKPVGDSYKIDRAMLTLEYKFQGLEYIWPNLMKKLDRARRSLRKSIKTKLTN